MDDGIARLKRVFASVLSLEEDSITDKTSFDSVRSWDSFSHLKLVSEIEKEFGTEFDVDEISSMENFGVIAELLRKHGAIK